jgi:hypothetical protein
MGRLDNIIARNRRPNRLHERLIVSMLLGVVVIVIIALAVFTDLGLPPEARDARGRAGEPAEQAAGSAGGQAGTQDRSGAQSTPGAPAAARGKRVDGVLLRVPPAKPAPH